MTKILFFQIILIATIITSCVAEQQQNAEPTAISAIETSSIKEIVNPRKMLNEAYQQFKEGNDDASLCLQIKFWILVEKQITTL